MDTQLELMLNARSGRGPCQDCVVRNCINSQHVVPGDGLSEADLMFIVEEPIRGIQWGSQRPWHSVSEIVGHEMAQRDLTDYLEERYLSEIEIDISDTWITHSLKCPPQLDGQDERMFNAEVAWAQCSEYLRRELGEVKPTLVVTLGDVTTKRVLMLLGLSDLMAKQQVMSCGYGLCVDTLEPPILKGPGRFEPADSTTFNEIQDQIAIQLGTGRRE